MDPVLRRVGAGSGVRALRTLLLAGAVTGIWTSAVGGQEAEAGADIVRLGATYAVPGAFDYWRLGPAAGFSFQRRRSASSLSGMEFQWVRLAFSRGMYLDDVEGWMDLGAESTISGTSRSLLQLRLRRSRTRVDGGRMLLATWGLGLDLVTGGQVDVDGEERYSASGLVSVGGLASAGLGWEVSSGRYVLVEPALHLALFPWTWAQLTLRLGLFLSRG